MSGLLYVQVRKPAGHATPRPRRKHDIRNAARVRSTAATADGSGPKPYRHSEPCLARHRFTNFSTLLWMNQAVLSKNPDTRRAAKKTPTCHDRPRPPRSNGRPYRREPEQHPSLPVPCGPIFHMFRSDRRTRPVRTCARGHPRIVPCSPHGQARPAALTEPPPAEPDARSDSLPHSDGRRRRKGRNAGPLPVMAAPFLLPRWPLPCSSFPCRPAASPAKSLRAGCGHFCMGKAFLRYRQIVRRIKNMDAA